MKKIIRLTESDSTRIVRRIINEDRTDNISKPSGYENFQKKCKTKDKGSFRTFADGVHLKCLETEGNFFTQDKIGTLIVKETPFKNKVGINGTWTLNGDKIELRTTL
jgi:hypothetical protein